MPLNDRIALYRNIERLRKRPLIVYVTSHRVNASGSMAADVVPEILDQINIIPKECKEVDLLVVSQGGDPTVAWRTICLLRERFDQIGVLVPQSAFSAATLLCLGADEILMHHNGNLGPVDPQIKTIRKAQNNSPSEVRFGFEEIVSFLDFVRDRAHITDQRELATILGKLLDDTGTVSIGIAVRGSMLSSSLGTNLLKMHMKGEGEAGKAKEIADTLNKKFFHHGYAVGKKEAKDIELKVVDVDDELEDLMWKVWQDIETELKMREPFNPTTEIANSPTAAPLFAPITSINLPQGLPPAILQQIYQQLIAQVQVQINNVPPVDSAVAFALLESRRLSSRFMMRRKIYGVRQHDGTLGVSVIDLSSGWENIPVPAEPLAEAKKQDIAASAQQPDDKGGVASLSASGGVMTATTTMAATEVLKEMAVSTEPRPKKKKKAR